MIMKKIALDLFWNQREPSSSIALAVPQLTVQKDIMQNTYLVAMLVTLWHATEDR